MTDRGRGRNRREQGTADLRFFGVQRCPLGFLRIFRGLGAFPDLTFHDGQTPGPNPVAYRLLGTFVKGFADRMFTSRAYGNHNPLQANQGIRSGLQFPCRGGPLRALSPLEPGWATPGRRGTSLDLCFHPKGLRSRGLHSDPGIEGERFVRG